jgi:ribosome biogenesis GTPase A
MNTKDDDEDLYSSSGYKKPTVNWYPGHIAKAERQLAETLKAVDVIVEVRDARACKATSHERVGEWCAGRPRIVVLTHVDQIPKLSLLQWKKSYETFGAGRWDAQVNAQVRNQAVQASLERQKYTAPSTKTAAFVVSPVENVLFVDAKQGQGIHAITRAIFKAGAHVQERRERRGLKERSLRVGIIGYPNVGKVMIYYRETGLSDLVFLTTSLLFVQSALINRILGRRRARTANTPGVTRSLQWIRVRTDEAKTKKKEFELLDSPGVIPANLVDQDDAALLAACNCIGQAAYDNQVRKHCMFYTTRMRAKSSFYFLLVGYCGISLRVAQVTASHGQGRGYLPAMERQVQRTLWLGSIGTHGGNWKIPHGRGHGISSGR